MTRSRTGRGTPIVAVAIFVLALLGLGSAARAEPFIIPPSSAEPILETGQARAVFAAGCFWGVQGVFQHAEGVISAVSGYAGGTADTAHYDQVVRGWTDHAEAVEVIYDPAVISYEELLHILFSVVHDPTQLNRQGPDVGRHYRSALFPLSEDQETAARAYIAQLDATGVYSGPIVTAIETFEAFYPAEDYHQDFMVLNPSYPYIVVHDLPKLRNFEALFPAMYREDPVLVGALG